MSSFGSKRKARIIKTADDEVGATDGASSGPSVTADTAAPLFGSKANRKPFRQSGLRKTFNTDEDESAGTSGDGATRADEDEEGPAVVRPAASRSSSVRPKSRPKAASKLSFGGEAGDPAAVGSDFGTPKKPNLSQRTLENNALRTGLGTRGLPVRSMQEEEDRPRYSKEYLAELQSTTPNTPQDVSALTITDPDEMELDASELEGALVVDTTSAGSSIRETKILSEAEIREKKERRARLAQEHGFLSMEDEDDDNDRLRKKKDDTRLKAEDEELGEGFDDYVEDGGLSLGKRAEKERKKQDRQQMAELIHNAEGNESDSSADSEAERRMAYEAAQTRAGMDGLKKPRKNPANELLQVPPKITPLPVLSECIARLQASLKAMEEDVKGKARRVQQLQSEKQEISKREGEVQALLDDTGKRYQEAMGKGSIENSAALEGTRLSELAGERGLESLGTTPQRLEGDDLGDS